MKRYASIAANFAAVLVISLILLELLNNAPPAVTVTNAIIETQFWYTLEGWFGVIGVDGEEDMIFVMFCVISVIASCAIVIGGNRLMRRRVARSERTKQRAVIKI